MQFKAIFTLAIVLFVGLADARPGAKGNMNPAATGSTYLIEGQRNGLSAGLTSDAISKAVTSGKAVMASAIGAKAAISASERSVALKAFDKVNGGNRRMLANGRAPGNMNPAATGSTYQIEGQRNELASSLTSDAISKAVASGKAFMAAATGSKAALSSTERSVALKSFDKVNGGGNRKLQQNRDRGEMVALSLQTAHASIERAISDDKLANGVKSAAKKNMEVARLSNKQSARAAEFTNDRRLLQVGDSRDIRVVMAAQQVHDQIAKAVSTNTKATTKIVTSKGLAFAKLVTNNSARAAEFSP